MKWFWRLCLLGLIGSLLIWALPDKYKRYHFTRWNDDWKIMFVEHTVEFGFDPSGLVYAHHVKIFEVPSEMGHTGEPLDRVRQDWIQNGYRSRAHWAVNSNRLEWDEWGPSHWHSPDGLKMAELGQVFCLPYSIIAITCTLLLALRGMFRFGRRRPSPMKLTPGEINSPPCASPSLRQFPASAHASLPDTTGD